MIRLILALSTLTLLACDGITGSGDDETGDTLYLVSTQPTSYYQTREDGRQLVHTVLDRHLEEGNGFALNKLTESVYGEGWDIRMAIKSTTTGYTVKNIHREFLTAPKNKAYYYDLVDSCWTTIKLSTVLDSMEQKGVWND